MPLSAAQIKTLRAYQQKKFREADHVFVAETPKVVEMLLRSELRLRALYAVEDYAEQLTATGAGIAKTAARTDGANAAKTAADGLAAHLTVISEKELARISGLSTPQQVLGLWETPTRTLSLGEAFRGVSLVLDGLQDPGNLGAVIRLADWFGIDRLLCSHDTADAFQPKCVQASMGAVAHLPVYYVDLVEWMQKAAREPREAAHVGADAASDGHQTPFPIYGTFLEGKNLFESKLEKQNAWYVIGNEAHGIRKEVSALINQKIHIPTFAAQTNPQRPHAAESLNAAVAAGILCAEIRR